MRRVRFGAHKDPLNVIDELNEDQSDDDDPNLAGEADPDADNNEDAFFDDDEVLSSNLPYPDTEQTGMFDCIRDFLLQDQSIELYSELTD